MYVQAVCEIIIVRRQASHAGFYLMLNKEVLIHTYKLSSIVSVHNYM